MPAQATYMVVSPEVPSYAICTHEVELRSLFASLAKFHPNAAYDVRAQIGAVSDPTAAHPLPTPCPWAPPQVLLSVHNPNRLDIQLEEAEATLSYKGDPVGTWRLEKPRNFPAGTVVDVRCALACTRAFSRVDTHPPIPSPCRSWLLSSGSRPAPHKPSPCTLM